MIPVSLPLVAIERASGSVSEICLSLLFTISALITLSRAISSFSFAILSLNRATLASGIASPRRSAVSSCAMFLNPLQASFHLGFGEVLIARIDSPEFGSVNGDARLAQQIKLAAQGHEGTANLTNGLAIVLAEIRDGLEVRYQMPRQPDQLDVALALAL